MVMILALKIQVRMEILMVRLRSVCMKNTLVDIKYIFNLKCNNALV